MSPAFVIQCHTLGTSLGYGLGQGLWSWPVFNEASLLTCIHSHDESLSYPKPTTRTAAQSRPSLGGVEIYQAIQEDFEEDSGILMLSFWVGSLLLVHTSHTRLRFHRSNFVESALSGLGEQAEAQVLGFRVKMDFQRAEGGNPLLLLLGKYMALNGSCVDTVGPASGSSHSELKELWEL